MTSLRSIVADPSLAQLRQKKQTAQHDSQNRKLSCYPYIRAVHLKEHTSLTYGYKLKTLPQTQTMIRETAELIPTHSH